MKIHSSKNKQTGASPATRRTACLINALCSKTSQQAVTPYPPIGVDNVI